MLTKCPECELQVSDKALVCPHCGFPFKEGGNRPRKPRAKNKHRRLPNGFGQISEIKNRNLRKPFRAMVTVGKDENGRPICKPLKPESYFETYNDAYTALVEYNRNPYDLNPSITVKELYERWFEEAYKDAAIATRKGVSSAWKYCSEIYDMRVIELRARHIKGCIENGVVVRNGKEVRPTDNVKSSIKSLFNNMLDYAVEYELVDRNYARTFSISLSEGSKAADEGRHIAFTEAEMNTLWENINVSIYVDMMIIQCYSGWRPQELCLLELKDVDLENWTFTGGLKTSNGVNRTVPIHTRIRGLVKNRYDEAVSLGSSRLFNTPKKHRAVTYNNYSYMFEHVVASLNINLEHRPHDCRVQFTTMAKEAHLDEYAIKRIVGHRIDDITERVYTKRNIEWLRSEIEKIK